MSTDHFIKKLEDCQFVGEVYLSIKELQELALRVATTNSPEYTQDLLLIVAVNCAYHLYDDEGFWKHFFDLINIPDSVSNRVLYGSIIENRLRKRGLLKRERRGPFRYVGAILEQCAVSKKHIYSFANVVKELLKRYGWKGICSLDYQPYLYFIRNLYCSMYLKNFLADPEGWEFTKQVARLCELYETGVLSGMDLEQIPGFQPEFWTEFFRVLERTEISVTCVNHIVVQKPFIYFNPDRLTIGISMDSSVVVDYPISDYWNAPITWLSHANMFSHIYSGHYSTNNGKVTNWEIKGWIPDGLPALFDSNWRYVNNDHVIPQGTYYLISTSLDGIACGFVEKIGTVNLKGETKYVAFLVTINNNSIIPGYEITNDTNITLAWEDEATYRFPCSVNSYPVFAGQIPRIRISDFNLISRNMIGLFYDFGNGPHMIKTIHQLDTFYDEIHKMAPVDVRLWLEPLSRNRYITSETIMPELNFSLVPKCQFVIEPELASSHEKPILNIITSANFDIYLNECIEIDDMSTKWLIDCMDNKIAGKITFGNVSIFIEIPIYRTRLYYENGNFIDCVCRGYIPCGKTLIATGLPGQRLVLGMLNVEQVIELGNFDDKGFCTFNSDAITPLLENHSDPISEFLIMYRGSSYRTGSVYIDLDQIRNINLSGEWPVEENFTSSTVSLLKYCSSLCRSPALQIHINRMPPLEANISEWIYTVFSCASVFDSTEFYVGDHLLDPLSLLSDSELKTTLYFFLEHRGEENSPNSLSNIDCIPKVERWVRKMERYSVSGRVKMIREWAVDINKKNPPYRNAISCLAGGHILSSAWHSYFKGKIENVPGQLNAVNSDSEIINELKIILESIVMLRFGRFERASLLLEKEASLDEVELVRKVLQNMVLIIQGKKELNQVILKEFDSCMLPLIDIDQKLIKHVALLSENIAEAKAYGRNCQDWLYIFVLVMFLDNGVDRVRLSEHLLDNRFLVPLSPQRNYIIKKLVSITKEEM